MISKTERLKRRRKALWQKNPRCFWCRVVTVLPPEDAGQNRKEYSDNEATIEHLRFRLDPTRQEPNPNNHPRTVLACRRCNNEHNRMEEMLAGKTLLQQQSQSQPADKEKLVAVINAYTIETKRLRKALIKIAKWEKATPQQLIAVARRAVDEKINLPRYKNEH